MEELEKDNDIVINNDNDIVINNDNNQQDNDINPELLSNEIQSLNIEKETLIKDIDKIKYDWGIDFDNKKQALSDLEGSIKNIQDFIAKNNEAKDNLDNFIKQITEAKENLQSLNIEKENIKDELNNRETELNNRETELNNRETELNLSFEDINKKIEAVNQKELSLEEISKQYKSLLILLNGK